MRGLSAALGLVTIVGTYLVVRELGILPTRTPVERSGAAALLAAMLVALSPMQIELSRTAHGYTLAMALLTLSGWAVLRALRGGKRIWTWLLCSALAAAPAMPITLRSSRLPPVPCSRPPIWYRGHSAPSFLQSDSIGETLAGGRQTR